MFMNKNLSPMLLPLLLMLLLLRNKKLCDKFVEYVD